MLAECHISGAFNWLSSLGFKFVEIFKRNTERVGALNMPYHVTTHILKLRPYLKNIFTINHNQCLVNIEIS